MTFQEWWKANSYKYGQADYNSSDYEEIALAAWDAARYEFQVARSAVPEAPLSEAERLSKKWLAAHPHAMMVVEHAGAMLRDALHPTAASVPSPLARSQEK